MALALAKLDVKLTVVDKQPPKAQHVPAFDGRVSALALGSKRMLDRLGAWQHMQPHAEPILDIRVSEGGSPVFLHYDHQEVGDEPFGWIVENRYTRIGLWKAAEAHENIEMISSGLTYLDAAAGLVVLEDGQELVADFIIAADGKFSKARELAGIAVHRVDYQETAIVCTIAHEKPHHGLAQERFLKRGPFAVLPMQADQSSLVWVEPKAWAKQYAELPKEELVQEITERVGTYLGTIDVVGETFTYPLMLTLAEQLSSGKLLLVGDAAHAVHPIAGQGINLGFRDVAVLADILEEAVLAGSMDINAVTKAYGKWRRFDTLSMATVTDGLNRLFGTSLLPVAAARNAGLLAVSHMPKLKQIFMRHAMGVLGDLPKLMRE